MTKIKLCGLTRLSDIEEANKLGIDYIGFVFSKKSKRYVNHQTAKEMKNALSHKTQAVGVFVDEPVENVAALLKDGIIDVAQLHGSEDDDYIINLKKHTNRPIIKAFRIENTCDFAYIEKCKADYVLLDSGAGSGETFNWDICRRVKRPFFLAGGLNVGNVEIAIRDIQPFAVDVSSGIETDGVKDYRKMTAFVDAVRKEKNYDK